MAKVEMNPETPSEAIVKAANDVRTVKDSQGNEFIVKKFTMLDRKNLTKAVDESSRNEECLNLMAPAFAVIEINGEHIPRAVKESQIDVVLNRLGDEGWFLAAKAIAEMNSLPSTKEEYIESVKN